MSGCSLFKECNKQKSKYQKTLTIKFWNYLIINGFAIDVCSAIQTDFVCKNSFIDS